MGTISPLGPPCFLTRAPLLLMSVCICRDLHMLDAQGLFFPFGERIEEEAAGGGNKVWNMEGLACSLFIKLGGL